MKKITGLLVVVILVAVCVWRIMDLRKAGKAGEKNTGKGGAVPVLLANVAGKPMPIEIRTFGTVEASASVTVRAQVTGILSEIGFAEGDEVKAGQLLFRIDPRAFEVDLRQAEAALARTGAQLTNAVIESKRVSDLFGKGFISESDRDVSLTAVATFKASVLADAAAVENARIQLDYCEIRSPIAGRAGRRLLDVGNLVSANATTLVTINQIAPVDVGFAIPQQEMFRVRGRAKARDLPVEAILAGNVPLSETGVLTFLDNTVDRTTGTLALKASFSNESRHLWPGQFVTVRMIVAIETNAVVIPYRAVQNGQMGAFVYVLRADSTVTNRPVKIERMVEEESIVEKGLEPGETVVTDGQQRLGPGSVVKNAAASPEPEARKPMDSAP